MANPHHQTGCTQNSTARSYDVRQAALSTCGDLYTDGAERLGLIRIVSDGIQYSDKHSS